MSQEPKKRPLISSTEPTSTPAPEQAGPATGDSVDKIVGNFFLMLSKDQVNQAYDYLTKETKISEKPQEVSALKSKTLDAIRIFGEIRGYELITIKNVGTRLMCATYLSLGKAAPLRWRFYFYKADKSWKLIDIRVDDQLVMMFEEKSPQLPQTTPEP